MIFAFLPLTSIHSDCHIVHLAKCKNPVYYLLSYVLLCLDFMFKIVCFFFNGGDFS